MPVRLPSFALPAVAWIVILVFSAGYAHAEQPADKFVVTIPQEFQLSGSAQPVSTGGNNAALTGSVEIIHTGLSSYLFIPAPDVVNGARLTAIQDSETGIVFRNNTMGLPVYGSQGRAAGLVLATADMMADRGGYLGRITGARLEIPGGDVATERGNFSAGVTVFLEDLPEGISYMTSLAEGSEFEDAIDFSLAPSGLSTLDVPLAIEADGADLKSRSAIEFMIVSLSSDQGWVERHQSRNITIYEVANDTAVPLSGRMLDSGSGRVVYQAVVPGPGTFALAAVGEKPEDSISVSISGLLDVLVFGGLLTMLVSGLVLMLRRIVKK